MQAGLVQRCRPPCRRARTRGRCAPARWRRGRRGGQARAHRLDEKAEKKTHISGQPDDEFITSSLQINLLRLVEQRQPHVSQIAPKTSGPLLCSSASSAARDLTGSISACARKVSISTARRDCTIVLVGGGLRQADVARHLVVRRVDGGQRRFHLGRRVDAGDQGRIEDDAVARRRGAALVVHVLVQVAQILAQVVDRNADHFAAGQWRCGGWRRAGRSGLGLGFEIGDALPQHRHEVRHDMHERLLDAEQKGVEIALAHAIADLAGQAGVELIFGDGFEARAVLVGRGSSRSSAMLTVMVAMETLWIFCQGILK